MKKTALIISIIFVLVMLLSTLLLRSDFISEKITAYAVKEIEYATLHKVTIEKAVVNLAPPFIEFRGITLTDDQERPVVKIKRMIGFIGIGRPLSKELKIRVKVTEPYFIIERYKEGTFNISPLVSSVEKYLKEEKRFPIKLDFNEISAKKGEVNFLDRDHQFNIQGKGISFDLKTPILQKGFSINAGADEVRLKIGSLPNLLIKAEIKLKGKDKIFNIEKLRLGNLDSSIGVEGDVNLAKKEGVDLKTKIVLLARSFKEFLGIKEKPSGEVIISGSIKGDLPRIEGGKLKTLPYIDLGIKSELPVSLLKALIRLHPPSIPPLLRGDKEGSKREWVDSIKGIINIKAQLNGKYPELRSKGLLSLAEGEVYGINIKKIGSRFSYESRQLTLSEIKGDILEGKLEGNITGIMPARGADTLFTHPDIIDSKGWVRYMKTSGREAKGLTPSIVQRAEITFSSGEGYLNIERGNVSTPRSSAEFHGFISLGTLEERLPFKIESDNFGEFVDPYYPGTKGAIDIKGEIKGTLSSPVLQGNAEIRSAEVKGVSVQRAYGGVKYEDKEISVSNFQLEQERSSFLLNGKVKFGTEWPFFDARVKIRNGDPRKITSIFYKTLPIETSFNGDMTFRGGGFDYEGEALLTFNRGKAYGQDFDKAKVNAILKRTKGIPGEVSFSSIQIERGNDILNTKGRIGFDGSFNAMVLSKRIALEHVNLLRTGRNGIPEITGNTTLRITGNGILERPEIIAKLELEKISYKEIFFGEGKISLLIKDGRLKTSARLGELKLDGEMSLKDDFPWRADLNINISNVRLDPILITDKGLKEGSEKLSLTTKGSIKAEGKGTDTDKIIMTAKFTSVILNIFGYSVHNDGNAELSLRAGELKVNSMKFSGPEGSALEIGGDIRLKHYYDLYLYGKADIKILRPFIPQIESINGDGEFMVALSDKWKNPVIQGMINFNGGSLKIRDFPQRIGKLSGILAFDKDRVVLNSLTGDAGGGKFNFSGFATLKGFSLKNFYLQGNAQGVRYRYFEGLTATFDGTLIYEGDSKVQTLNGEVNFRRAIYNRRIDWKTWLLEVRKIEEKPKVEVSPLLNTNLNIHISGNIQVDNNIGKGPMRLDLLLKGTPIRPLLFGRIESNEGQIFFRNNSFRIVSASADFFDPNRIYPVFNVVADTELKGYRIHLSLSGPADRFLLSLSSDPPLSEADILALLTVGQPSKGLQGLEAGVGASEAASFITGKLQDVLEERFRNIIGLDRFQVDPYVTRSSVAGGPRVTVGKSLLNGRLYVTYSANIGTTEEQVLRLEYKLSMNVYLIGVRDEQGQIGGDMKFHFEFR